MSFKDAAAADIRRVFLNLSELGERRTVLYDGVTYADIPVMLSVIADRKTASLNTGGTDHAQGLHRAACILHCAGDDLGGRLPERGARLRIREGSGFCQPYRVAEATEHLGLYRITLEELDE